MKAIILAAGRGSRLKGFTEDKPKCLNTVANRPLLNYQLSAFNEAGIKDIVLVTGYKNEMLEEFKTRTVHNARWAETNMLFSLLCAAKEFDTPTIVSYSDIIYGKSIISQLMAQEHDITVVYDKDWYRLWQARFANPLDDAESFHIDANERITDIGRKVSDLSEIQGQYIGLMRFSPKGFSWIKEFTDKNDIQKMDMTTLLRNLIQAGRPVHGMGINGGWCEVDTVNDLQVVQDLFSKGELVLK